jgi:hypothetical protein
VKERTGIGEVEVVERWKSSTGILERSRRSGRVAMVDYYGLMGVRVWVHGFMGVWGGRMGALGLGWRGWVRRDGEARVTCYLLLDWHDCWCVQRGEVE